MFSVDLMKEKVKEYVTPYRDLDNLFIKIRINKANMEKIEEKLVGCEDIQGKFMPVDLNGRLVTVRIIPMVIVNESGFLLEVNTVTKAEEEDLVRYNVRAKCAVPYNKGFGRGYLTIVKDNMLEIEFDFTEDDEGNREYYKNECLLRKMLR